ncbi:hypothetical protein DICPUDRAFT_150707 [Dictyostelium purpureum]|uniref:Uncharacterized protein n=1 Tax=Dictyostelium purpureum TaxID=5786 RepID=F0ZH17_DICPU|nr:uncharacterized protein DICPUDRAFT_150707 [Dictyostelium purpureum]EGC36752.1 hypothetical protein DICPUDRAFT_150707 [Dictyostelium purpureum]|eukprot:XP_003286698.1 hypothetical protein DICPUDRAFT_150707 [Dictyostelium purpureum]
MNNNRNIFPKNLISYMIENTKFGELEAGFSKFIEPFRNNNTKEPLNDQFVMVDREGNQVVVEDHQNDDEIGEKNNQEVVGEHHGEYQSEPLPQQPIVGDEESFDQNGNPYIPLNEESNTNVQPKITKGDCFEVLFTSYLFLGCKKGYEFFGQYCSWIKEKLGAMAYSIISFFQSMGSMVLESASKLKKAMIKLSYVFRNIFRKVHPHSL